MLTIAESQVTNLTTDLAAKAPLVSPSFTTPSLGVATATSINGTTIPSSATLATSATTSLPSLVVTESQVTNLTTDLAAKVTSVTAGDSTITIGGTSTAPTVKVGTVPYASVSGTPTALPPNGTAGGSLSGSYPNPSIASSGVTAATYGSATAVPAIAIGADGRVTSASNTTIAIAESQVTNLTTDLAAKAPLASPVLTGTPTAPTATALTNSTQLATTAYADSAVGVEKTRALAAEALSLPLAGGTMTGYITLSGQSVITGGSSKTYATVLTNQYNQIQSATLATQYKLPDLAASSVNTGDFVIVQNTGAGTINATIYPYSVGGASSTQSIDGSSAAFGIAANTTAIFWCTAAGSGGTWSTQQLDLSKGQGTLPLTNVAGVVSGSTALSSDKGGLRPVGSMYYGGTAIVISTGSTTTYMSNYTMTSNYAVGGMTVNTSSSPYSGLQVPVAGYYQVNVSQQVQSSSSANRFGLSVQKNGVTTPILQGNFMTNGTTNSANFILVASGIVLLAANDVLSWQVFNSAANLTINPGAALSTLSATLVGT